MEAALLQLCKRLISTPSVTTQGTRQIAELCAGEILSPAGISARIVASSGEGMQQVNLVAKIEGKDPGAVPLVLNTHLDTVPQGEPSLWTACAGDPFLPVLEGDRIYGLGAADTKLDFAAKMTALLGVRRPRRSVWLVGTFGEERGLLGAKELIASGALPRPALAFVGEPSGLELITAHKGLVVFTLTVRFTPPPLANASRATRAIFIGRASHSSTPALGRSAIRDALLVLAAHPELRVLRIDGGDAVNRVPERCEVEIAGEAPHALAGAARVETLPGSAHQPIPAAVIAILARFLQELQTFADRSGPTQSDYASPTLTCNAGVLRSLGNVLELEFELRPPPGMALEAVTDGVALLVSDAAQAAPEIELKLNERRRNPAFRSADGSAAVECAIAAMATSGLACHTGVKTGCTEAGVYAAAGLDPVVIGPGPSTGVIHAPNEYNLLPQVEAAAAFYRNLLQS